MQRLFTPGASLDDILASLRTKLPADDETVAPQHDIEPACGQCRDVGFLRRNVPVDHAEFGRPIECPCGLAGRRRRARIWAEAGIPDELADASFETYPVSAKTAPILDIVRGTWLDAAPAWLVLRGLSGRGKSSLVVSALRELAQRGHTVRFMTAPDLFDWIRESYDETLGVRESDRLAELRGVHALAIDDLGREQATAWVQMRLWSLLNARHGARLPTLFTTNLDLAAFAARVGESAYSRIEQASGPDGRFILKLDGPDLRVGGWAR